VADKFELLDLGFPNSLFIRTVREVTDWPNSRERFWKYYEQFASSPDLRALHFAKRPTEIPHINICAGEGWPQLAVFLEIPIPAEPFPHDHAPGGVTVR